jgi:hypothetical protein
MKNTPEQNIEKFKTATRRQIIYYIRKEKGMNDKWTRNFFLDKNTEDLRGAAIWLEEQKINAPSDPESL